MTSKHYKEILKLDQLLTEMKIPHQTVHLADGWQVMTVDYAPDERRGISAVEHYGSYGSSHDLIEVWDRRNMKDPEGWKSAREAARYFRRYMENQYGKERP